MAQDPEVKMTDDGLAVIHVALFRMATKSMASAYRILGYKTHHGDEDALGGNPWVGLEAAAEATWPDVPGARPGPHAPFTRRDWDDLWGDRYDVVTDMACPFADQLVAAYPNAKVVVVQRDFDSWWPSLKAGVLDNIFLPTQRVILFLLEHVLRSRAGPAMAKMCYGLFGAHTPQEIEANARGRYDAYYRRIRELVPPERRLEYAVGDGWEPLCAFLGRPVPDVPFPRLNDRSDRQQRQRDGERMVYVQSARRLAPWVVGLAAVLVPVFYLRR